MSPAPVALIDPGALRHNLQQVRKRAPAASVMAVVKANAYGHGLGHVTGALAEADAFAVARIAEGIALRELGTRRRILILEGIAHADELSLARDYSLDLVVHQTEQIDWLGNQAAGLNIWLKLDSGMHRLGFSPAEFSAALARLEAIKPDSLTLMTHFASADLRDDPCTERQLKTFAAEAGSHAATSVANSAGLMAWPASRSGWVRPGIMLYGISPFADRDGGDLGLRPAMQLQTQLLATRRVKSGDAVGYCGTWTASEETIIGTAAIGYGDGYPGNLPGGTPVLVNGRRCELAGRVSMDLITIDLGPQATERPGAEVTLWGAGLAVEDIARRAGRLSYELVCGIAHRVPRIVIGD